MSLKWARLAREHVLTSVGALRDHQAVIAVEEGQRRTLSETLARVQNLSGQLRCAHEELSAANSTIEEKTKVLEASQTDLGALRL